MDEKNRINPFRIMVDPRGFILRGAVLFKKWMPLLTFLIGLSWLFAKAYAYSLGYNYSFLAIFIFCLVFAIPVGYALLYLTSFIFYWVGKIFKGKAKFNDVLAAYGWTRIIDVFVIATWIGFVGVYGKYAFTPMLVYSDPMSLIVFILILVQLVFIIWEAVVLFHTLGQVQGFSAWIAIWNVLFAWAILLMLDGFVNWLVLKSFVWKPITTSLLGIL